MSNSVNVLQFTDTHLFADPKGEMDGCITNLSLRNVVEQAVLPHLTFKP